LDAYTILTRLDFLIILVYKLKAVNGRRLSLQALVVPEAVEVNYFSILRRKVGRYLPTGYYCFKKQVPSKVLIVILGQSEVAPRSKNRPLKV